MKNLMSHISAWYLKQAYHAELKNVLGHIEVVRRLERAYDILTRDERYSIVLVCPDPLEFRVTSPNDSYIVKVASQECTCPDGEVLCKHRLAIKLILSTIRLMKTEGVQL